MQLNDINCCKRGWYFVGRKGGAIAGYIGGTGSTDFYYELRGGARESLCKWYRVDKLISTQKKLYTDLI